MPTVNIGELILYPADNINPHDIYGMIIEIRPCYFSGNRSNPLDDEDGYVVEWFDNTESTEDSQETLWFRNKFLDKHPPNVII